MTDEELRKLLDVAKAATPGPWHVHMPRSRTYIRSAAGHYILDPYYGTFIEENAEHVAAFDPPTATALVTELLSLRAEVAAAKAKLDLHADTLRMDWLEDYVVHATVGFAMPANADMTPRAEEIEPEWMLFGPSHDNELGGGETLREAVDSARAARAKEESNDVG